MKFKALIIALLLLLGLSSFPAGIQAAGAYTGDKDVLAWSEDQLDIYYGTLFRVMGQTEYTTPTVVLIPHDGHVMSMCGYMGMDMDAFYCSMDQTIYLGKDLMDQVSVVDDFVPALVLAHEWGHHIQYLTGADDTLNLPEMELGADCMAGAWIASIEDRGYVDDGDIAGWLYMSSLVGGGDGSHGSDEDRVHAVFTGYEHGMTKCEGMEPE